MPSSAGEHSPQTFALVGGGGQGRLQSSWKTGDRMKTKGALGLRSRPRALGGDHLTLARLVRRHFWNALLTHLGKSKLHLSSMCLCSQEDTMDAAAPTGLGSGPTAQWVWGGPLAERMGVRVGSRSWVSYQERGSDKRVSAGYGSWAA